MSMSMSHEILYPLHARFKDDGNTNRQWAIPFKPDGDIASCRSPIAVAKQYDSMAEGSWTVQK